MVSSNIVNLQDYRKAQICHITGEARCLECFFEWVATEPQGTRFIECPSCGCYKGTFAAQVEIDCPHWTCNCGNSLFYATEDGMYCPMCGLFQNGF